MRFISLYSGAGGLDLGIEAAGGVCLCAIEQDPDSCETLRQNGRGHTFEGWIEHLPAEVLREWLDVAPGELDLIVGGPPCQPFSKSAQWASAAARGMADARSSTLTSYFEYVAEFRPRAFLLENVEGFARGGGLSLVEQKLKALAANGVFYSLSYKICNTADYGVPQSRRRFIAVGMRDAAQFTFPGATHGPNLLPRLSAWDAIFHAGKEHYEETLEVKGRWSGLLPTIPPGSNYLWHTAKGGGKELFGWRTKFWSFLLKLDPERPSPTLVANPSQNSGPFHWENRLLSTNELSALQTFPAGYRFHGNRVSRQRQIGNAVPPRFAAVVGRALHKQLGFRTRPTQPAPNRAVSRLVVVPLGALEPRYAELIGTHAPHGGTGRGPKPRSLQSG